MKRKYEMNNGDEQVSKLAIMKTLLLALVVVTLHVVAIGGFFTIQGCGTVRPGTVVVEPAPAPVMPPRAVSQRPPVPPPPAHPIRPPRSAPPAPPLADPVDQQTYVVQSGDSLSKIAYRYNISSKELAEINNISNQNIIRVGQRIVLPPYARLRADAPPVPTPSPRSTASSRTTSAAAAPAAPVAAGDEYVVQSGDSLSRIAVRNGTTVSALRELNKLTSDRILVGQKLKIPGASKPEVKKPDVPPAQPTTPRDSSSTVRTEPAPAAEKDLIVEEVVIDAPSGSRVSGQETHPYVVHSGDTIAQVAMFFQLTREELAAANNMRVDDPLTPGTTIQIPIP